MGIQYIFKHYLEINNVYLFNVDIDNLQEQFFDDLVFLMRTKLWNDIKYQRSVRATGARYRDPNSLAEQDKSQSASVEK